MLPIDICTIGVKGLWSGHPVCIESLEKLSSEYSLTIQYTNIQFCKLNGVVLQGELILFIWR